MSVYRIQTNVNYVTELKQLNVVSSAVTYMLNTALVFFYPTFYYTYISV